MRPVYVTVMCFVACIMGGAAFSQSAAPSAGGTRDPRAYFTDTVLLTQDGRKVRFYSDMLKDRVAVVNVMFATCHDACPIITQQMARLRDELGEAFGKRVFFVSITSDPERDTPQMLKKFAREQHVDSPAWSFLTGGQADVYGVLARLGAKPTDVTDHITVLYVLDVDNKRMRRVLPNAATTEVAQIVREVASGGKS